MPKIRNFTGVSKGERQFFNYDFTDVLTGESYVTYYLGYADAYKMKPFTFFDTAANNRTEYASAAEGAYTLKGTVNFDTNVEKRNTVDGDFYFEGKYGATATSGAAIFVKIYAYLIRVRDGASVTIASKENFAAFEDTSGRKSAFMDCARTALKPGDTLRVQVKVYSKGGASGLAKAGFWHDPEETAEELIVKVPFEVDV